MTLVLLPGMDGTGDLFDPLVAALGAGLEVRVVRYPSTEPLGYAELESIAHAQLPVEGPFVILGESFSGPIAVSLASCCGPRLKGLVMCCSFVCNPRPGLSFLGWLVGVLPIGLAPVSAMSHWVLGRFATPLLRRSLVQAIAKVSPSTLRTRLRAVMAVDVASKFSVLDVPVLYLQASHDRLVPPSAASLVQRLRPDTQTVTIDAPHFLLQVRPAEVANIITTFVRKVADVDLRVANA